MAFLPSRSSPVRCSLLIVEEASTARPPTYKLVVDANVALSVEIVVVASVVVPVTVSDEVARRFPVVNVFMVAFTAFNTDV